MKHRLTAALLMLVLLVIVPRRASAYVDPGTGSVIWQLLTGVIIGFWFYIYKLLRKLHIGRRSGQDSSATPGPPKN